METLHFPLLGWGIGMLFGLPAAAFIALVLAASSPGGPFGAKLAMVQGGDVVAGAAMQGCWPPLAVSLSPPRPTGSSAPPVSARESPST
ncbi:hypothetical protein ACFW5D_21490 [Streptomyces sp. NPDC058770]|uniref:hypothetical protein n=1 Tax=Streptomyces sp. NPDC058770 TaxID=3346631 RepID=UPI0036B2AD14